MRQKESIGISTEVNILWKLTRGGFQVEMKFLKLPSKKLLFTKKSPDFIYFAVMYVEHILYESNL